MLRAEACAIRDAGAPALLATDLNAAAGQWAHRHKHTAYREAGTARLSETGRGLQGDAWGTQAQEACHAQAVFVRPGT